MISNSGVLELPQYTTLTLAEQIAAENYGLIPGEVSDEDIRTFIEPHKK